MNARIVSVACSCLGLALALGAGCSDDPTEPETIDPTAIGQVVEQAGRLDPLDVLDSGGEAVAFLRQRFDERRAVGLSAQRLAQPFHCLDDAVVGDGDAVPGAVDDVFFEDRLAVVREEEQQNVHLPVAEADPFGAVGEAALVCVELEGAEGPQVREVAHFGSTSCKALFVCRGCGEPFDHFKAL